MRTLQCIEKSACLEAHGTYRQAPRAEDILQCLLSAAITESALAVYTLLVHTAAPLAYPNDRIPISSVCSQCVHERSECVFKVAHSVCVVVGKQKVVDEFKFEK